MTTRQTTSLARRRRRHPTCRGVERPRPRPTCSSQRRSTGDREALDRMVRMVEAAGAVCFWLSAVPLRARRR